MAETTNQNSNPAGAPPAGTQQNGGNITSPAGSGQASRPAWLPEGVEKPEDFRAKYDDLDRRFKEAEPRLKNLERWEKWGDPDQFEKNLAARIAERDKTMRAQIEAELRQTTTQPQQHRDPFEGYELLDPRQQAQVLRDQVAASVNEALKQQVDQYWKTAEGRIGEMDQRFSLLSRALSARAENPDLDLNGLWAEASKLATGDQNKLFDLAVDHLTQPKKIEKQIAQAVAAEKAKWEQEQANKNQAALVGSGSGASAASFKDTLAARKGDGKESLRMRIMQKGVEEGWLQPGQV
jgi:hypothetical protein